MKLKYFTSFLLIFSFIAIALFSFAIFDHQPNHQNNGCLAYTLDGVACPTNLIEFAMHHVSGLRTLSKTLVSQIFNASLLLAFLFLFSISIRLLSQGWPPLEFVTNYKQHQLTRWLALLEHSPSA